MKKIKKIIPSSEPPIREEVINFPGYPIYPASEDIYSKFRKDLSIDPEDTSQMQQEMDTAKVHTRNEQDFNEERSERRDEESELDVPGSELDDEQERIGSEDEENNYYSVGGDNHDDLEENRSESADNRLLETDDLLSDNQDKPLDFLRKEFYL